MEGLSRTSNDINWIIEGEIEQHPCLGTGATIENMLSPNYIIYRDVCDWNLVLSSSDSPYPNQTYSTQIVFNIERL
jgi:hypothetical protein